MSADNWAKCPRCVHVTRVALTASDAKVAESYGQVPVEEFDSKRKNLAAAWAKFEEWDTHRTFREDYEIYGAETGVVKVSYSGQCTECGTKKKFACEYRIDGWDR